MVLLFYTISEVYTIFGMVSALKLCMVVFDYLKNFLFLLGQCRGQLIFVTVYQLC